MHAGSIVNTVSFKSASQSPQTVVKTYLIFWGFDDYGSLYRGLECNECSGFSVQCSGGMELPISSENSLIDSRIIALSEL